MRHRSNTIYFVDGTTRFFMAALPGLPPAVFDVVNAALRERGALPGLRYRVVHTKKTGITIYRLYKRAPARRVARLVHPDRRRRPMRQSSVLHS